MKPETLPNASKNQLDLVLGFFSRVDAKASVVLAVDTAMAGYLASHLVFPYGIFTWQSVAPLLTFSLIAHSLWQLYRGSFPNLSGGNNSIIYFQEVAKRTESKFIDEFCSLSETDHAKEILGQAWRNSQILTDKFNRLRVAFIFMALAVPPWVISLAQYAVFQQHALTKNP